MPGYLEDKETEKRKSLLMIRQDGYSVEEENAG